jgi:hypothetical protein
MTDRKLAEEVRKLRREVQELRDRQAIHDCLVRFERRDGEWRIAAREVLVDWACTVEGEIWPAIGVFPMGAWDRTDASYQRPLRVPVEGARPLNE